MIANISQSLAPHHGGKNSWHNSDMGWRNYVTVTITYMYVSVFRNIFNHDTLPKLIRSRHERRRCYRVVRWDRLFSHNTGRTDRRTDWQTDGNAIASTALAMRALRRAVKTNNSQYSQCVYHTLCQCIISRTFAYKINKKFNDDDEDWRLLITQFSSHPCSSNIYMYLQKNQVLVLYLRFGYLYSYWYLTAAMGKIISKTISNQNQNRLSKNQNQNQCSPNDFKSKSCLKWFSKWKSFKSIC